MSVIIVPRSMIVGLDFDLDAALARFAEAKEAHKLTVDVPAPTAHPLVEMVFNAGGYTIDEDVPEPQPEPEPTAPDRVSARQFKLQLLADGILEQVEAWIASQGRAIQLAYDNSSEFVRDEPMMQAGFRALGFPSEQITAFFSAASKR